ncbi:MAG: hypothetical protein GXP08_13115 [Gammaproteobacteria bacterium]|nr:hypothetical protein [Gammaproteobacteria bacterium]
MNALLRPCQILFWFVCALPALTACSVIPANSPVAKPALVQTPVFAGNSAVDGSQDGWWRVAYHLRWEEGEEPSWHMDALIAHQVVKPILEQVGGEIKIWRFHRRAVRDASGHRFSFLFYCSNTTAKKLYHLLEHNDIVAALKRQGMIERLSFSDINTNKQPGIGDTSDKAWSVVLQQAWPYFVMGVSQTWLALIDKVEEKKRVDEALHTTDQVARYKESNDQVTKLWEQQGGHAFLHHLNALFGYQALFVYERKRARY